MSPFDDITNAQQDEYRRAAQHPEEARIAALAEGLRLAMQRAEDAEVQLSRVREALLQGGQNAEIRWRAALVALGDTEPAPEAGDHERVALTQVFHERRHVGCHRECGGRLDDYLFAGEFLRSDWLAEHDTQLLRWAADRCCTCHTGDGRHEDWCVAVGILGMCEAGEPE